MISSRSSSGKDDYAGSGYVLMYSSALSLTMICSASPSYFYKKETIALSPLLLRVPAETNFY
jgi:hypothetical protein